jgi:hypothetical protein
VATAAGDPGPDAARLTLAYARQAVAKVTERQKSGARTDLNVTVGADDKIAVYGGDGISVTSDRGTIQLEKGEGLRVSPGGRDLEVRKLLGPPELLGPAGGKVLYNVGELELSWKKQEGAASYMLELAKDEEFKETLAGQSMLAATTARRQLSGDGTYYWRVRAVDEEGFKGLPSGPSSFEVKTDREAPPISVDKPVWE